MALIGSISIKLGVDSSKLTSGLASSTRALRTWEASASSGSSALSRGMSDLSRGVAQAASGLRDLRTLSGGLASSVAASIRPVASIFTGWGKHLGAEVAAPIRSSFATVFQSIAGVVGPPLSKTSAAVASFASGVGARLSGAFGRAFDAVAPFGVALGRVALGFGNVSRGASAVGVALARLGVARFASVLGTMSSSLGSVGSAFLAAAASAAKFAAVAGVVGLTLGVKAAAAAAHLNETVNTTEQVFGEAADGMLRSAAKMSVAYGTARKAYLEGANALGSQFQSVGYSDSQSAALSDQILKLAADANAARDPAGGFAEALGKIRSGLSGEAEPLKAWGLDLSETAVKVEAVTMGLVKQGAELTNAAKVQARMSLITKGLGKDQGALAREATGPAAQIAEFWGRAQTLLETVGASLAPVLGGALEVVNTAVLALTDAWGSLSGGIYEFVGGVGASVGAWAASVAEFFELGQAQTSVWRVSLGFLANAWQTVGIAFKAVAVGVLSGFTAIFEGLSYVGMAIDKVVAAATGESAGLSDYFGRLSDKLYAQTVDQADALAKAWAEPWASATDAPDRMAAALAAVPDKVKAAYDAAALKIKTVRDELAKPVAVEVGAPKDAAGPVEKAKNQAPRDPFSGAFELGSKEAASVVLRSKFGGGSKDGTAENTKRSADALARIDRHQREMVKILRDRNDGLVPMVL